MDSAIFSDCGTYRYRLEREGLLPGSGKTVAFFGVNPSTADAVEDDATVRKWRGFTYRMGAGKFIVGNVFAYRSTNVRKLATCADPVGPLNRRYLFSIADDADVLVPCWGSRGKLPKQLRHYLDAFMADLLATGKPVMSYGVTKSGDPPHVLMLGYDTPLTAWDTTR